MQRRNAALNYYYFILLLVGVLLSTVSRRLEPVCAVLPLAVALLYSRVVRTTPRFMVSCRVTPQRAFEGDHITVAVTLQAETALPPTEFWHVLPPEATCVAGSIVLSVPSGTGRSALWQHEVIFAQRGKYALGRLYGRVHPPTHLQPLLLEATRSRSVVCTLAWHRCRVIFHRYTRTALLARMSHALPAKGWNLPVFVPIAAATACDGCIGGPPWHGSNSMSPNTIASAMPMW